MQCSVQPTKRLSAGQLPLFPITMPNLYVDTQHTFHVTWLPSDVLITQVLERIAGPQYLGTFMDGDNDPTLNLSWVKLKAMYR
jgi:hypothetical protein